jgi:LPPG:FO 2-phospho-L-lactate transferase
LLALPALRQALSDRRDDIVAVSPIVAGSALKGPADRLMTELGSEASVVGVARLYAPWVGTLVIDEADGEHATAVEATGLRCVVAPTIMDTLERSAALARILIGLNG